MKTIARIAGATLLLFTGVGAATAQTTTTTVIEQRGPATVVERRAPVVLTPEQRTVIYQNLQRLTLKRLVGKPLLNLYVQLCRKMKPI